MNWHLSACGMKGWQKNDAVIMAEVTCRACKKTKAYKGHKRAERRAAERLGLNL
jgi:hypothetical protein